MKAMAPILLACCMSGAAGVARRAVGCGSSMVGFVRPLLPQSQQQQRGLAAARATGVRMMAAVAEGAAAASSKALDTRVHTGHPKNNVPVSLSDKIGRELHRTPSHPLGIIKDR